MPRKKDNTQVEPVVAHVENNSGDPTLKDIVASINGLVTAVKEIKKDVDSMKSPSVNVSVSSTVDVSTDKSSMPVPDEYKELVKNILNHNFGIRLEPRTDIPAFIFNVIVPEKYRTVNSEYIKTYKEELRPKVISYAEGSNGVREWCETVFNNFNPDMRSLITADRFK